MVPFVIPERNSHRHLFTIAACRALEAPSTTHPVALMKTDGVLPCKPTRADYSATTGSQTARHNATHLLNTKQPKSILHSKKHSVAFQSRG